MKKQICSYCVMDNVSDSTIRFNEFGQCNYCRDTIERLPREYFPNETGKRMLEEIVVKMKEETKNDKYNCMVGVSGGIDSSYLLYLGYKYDLRMLAVHIDDGLDTVIAKENIEKLCNKTNTKLIVVQPDIDEYKDLLLSFFKASVPNLALPQDNILQRALADTAKEYSIKYALSGANFSLECILERGEGVNLNDKVHILDIHKKFGERQIKSIKFRSLMQAYLGDKYFRKVKSIKPLNFIDYNLERALKELESFCGFVYYGGKHYESVLTRFLQCYYLPIKYNKDKRKSHFSSMIVSGQLSRKEALKRLRTNPYLTEDLFYKDFQFLATYFGLSTDELMRIIDQEPKQHSDYRQSILNNLAPLARKFRRFLG